MDRAGEGRAPARRLRALHWWFVALVGISGAALAVLTPPGKPPDEISHLYRTWTLAHGQVFADVQPDGDAGAQVPACLGDYVTQTYGAYLQVEPLHLDDVWSPGRSCGDDGGRGYASFGNAAVNSPVTYLPQAAAVAALDALGQPMGHVVLGARLAALATYLALGAAAIKLATRARLWLFTAACLPAAVGLASTLSSDTVVLGLALLSVSLVIRLRHPAAVDGTPGAVGDGDGDEDDPAPVSPSAPPSTGLRVALAVTLLALVLAKNSYGPFVLLWLLVPPASTDGRRRWAERSIVPALGVLLAGLWYVKVRGITRFPPSVVIPEIDPQRQLPWVVAHPLSFVAVMWRTLGSTEFFGGILPRIVGRFPSGRPGPAGAVHSPPVPWAVLGAVVMGFVLSALVASGRQRRAWSPAAWAVTVAVGVACSVLVLVLVYAVSSPVGGPRVLLLQGRYFTPLLGLGALLLAERWQPRPWGGRVVAATWAVVLLPIVSLAGTVAGTWLMYYR